MSKAFKWRTRTRAGSPVTSSNEINTLAAHMADSDPHPGMATKQEVKTIVESKTGALESLAGHKTNQLAHAPTLVRRDELATKLAQYHATKNTDYTHDASSYNSLADCAKHVVTTQLLFAVLESFASDLGEPISKDKVVTNDNDEHTPVVANWGKYIPAYSLYRGLKSSFESHSHSPDYIHGVNLIAKEDIGDTVSIVNTPGTGTAVNVDFTAKEDCWILVKGYDYYNNSQTDTWLSAIELYNGSTKLVTLSEPDGGCPTSYDGARNVTVPAVSKLFPLTKGVTVKFSAQFSQIELKFFPLMK